MVSGNGPWTARQAARISTRVRELREARGLGVRELGRLAKVSPNTVSGIERGKQPDLGTMLALQRALGCESIEELLGPYPPSQDLRNG